ncbi:type II 3-dehydroquinate dehydratase [Microbacterium sp. A196]|uniref:type II 3-dehydroquinate dehydratase n=1 Tax=Microbacterium sp. A196 TaxID=3457320 RepID=UPI003FCFF8E8
MALRESARTLKFAFVNGPNMGQLGKRNPGLFGPVTSLDALNAMVDEFAADINVEIVHFQSDIEGEILHFIHETTGTVDGFLINPAGLTYFGQATRDALTDTGAPYMEVHFANLSTWKHSVDPGRDVGSIFSHTAVGIYEGMRHYGYFAAVLSLALAIDDTSFLGADK